MQLISCGAVSFLHLGTPCNTFSAARKEDGGPPPLRSEEFPEGLPDLDGDNLALATLGNLFMDRSAEAADAIVLSGGDFSLENPPSQSLVANQADQAVALYRSCLHC